MKSLSDPTITPGQALGHWLESHNFTREWLAQTLGTAVQNVNNWIKDRGKPRNAAHTELIRQLTGIDLERPTRVMNARKADTSIEERVATLEKLVTQLLDAVTNPTTTTLALSNGHRGAT